MDKDKKKVPKLELPKIKLTSSDDDAIDSGDNLNIMSKLHIKYDNQSQMFSHDDLEKMHKLYKAQKSLASRKNIEFSMEADVLLALSKISQNEQIHLRLVFEPIEKDQGQNDKEIKNKHLSIHISPNTSPLSSPKNSPKGSPKNSPKNSNRNSSKNSHRSDLSNSDSNIDDSSNDETQKKTRTRILSSNDKKPFTLLMANNVLIKKPRKNMIISGEIVTVFYEITDVNYSIFIIEKQNNEVVCRGITDVQIMGYGISDLKSANVEYEFLGINAAITIYTKDISTFDYPIYFCLSNDKFECKIEQFVETIENVVKLGQIVYKNKLQQ